MKNPDQIFISAKNCLFLAVPTIKKHEVKSSKKSNRKVLIDIKQELNQIKKSASAAKQLHDTVKLNYPGLSATTATTLVIIGKFGLS